MQAERRKNRSSVMSHALQHQLEASAARSQLNSAFLVDSHGFVIAASAPSKHHDEIAALSRQLPQNEAWQGEILTEQGVQNVTLAPIETAYGPMVVCGVGDGVDTQQELTRGGMGVTRIVETL